MVMAEKAYPVGIVEELGRDIKGLFTKEKPQTDAVGKPGDELPAFGKCGCHPGGIHPTDTPIEVEQHVEVDLIAIPVKLENIPAVRVLPAKRGSLETFYPGTSGNAVMIQGKDPRIKRLIITVSTQACWLGSQEAVKALSGANTVGGAGLFQAPAGTANMVWEGIDFDIWGQAVTAGSVVSVRREYWPDI